MTTYQIHSKVAWEELVKDDFTNSFYPSLVKKLTKSDEYFKSSFAWQIIPLPDLEGEEVKLFFTLYNESVASRDNYMYKKGEQENILLENIKEGTPYFLFALFTTDKKFAGGIIFSLRKESYRTVLRVFDQDIRYAHRSQTTVDFWVEKEFYEYARTQKVASITHGTDNFPNIGRAGLPLFKLKVGAKPIISKKVHDIIPLNDVEILKKEDSVLFFDDADESNHFKTCRLFYQEQKIDESVLGELTKVLAWANLEFIATAH